MKKTELESNKMVLASLFSESEQSSFTEVN